MQQETESRITEYSKDRQNAEARESFLARVLLATDFRCIRRAALTRTDRAKISRRPLQS
jgi:hypothetical protein